MYKDSDLPATILIIRTSSLGDVIQTFPVLEDLKSRFPQAQIDWAVESSFCPIVAAHPYIRRAVPLHIKQNRNILKSLKELRMEKYDLVFDLQGNCKSGVVTLFSRGKVKIGFGLKSVREWPNILATHKRFNVSRQTNICIFYLKLIESYFKSPSRAPQGIRLEIGDAEKEKVAQILLKGSAKDKIMVCPGSKWENKQLKEETLIAFLKKIGQTYPSSFFLVWGSVEERALCEKIASHLTFSTVIERLALPTWQNLMNEMDLVIAVDSSALHLAATTKTPSFSIFGPTSLQVFKPVGERHFALQGKCPYGKRFDKQCPILRSCPTGACMKDLSAEELFQAFQNTRCAAISHL